VLGVAADVGREFHTMESFEVADFDHRLNFQLCIRPSR
jgi:hypothetical protein